MRADPIPAPYFVTGFFWVLLIALTGCFSSRTLFEDLAKTPPHPVQKSLEREWVRPLRPAQ